MTAAVSSSSEDAAAARAAEQVRLRKQRREAKIKAGGASRLDKITGLGGGVSRGWYTTRSTSSQYRNDTLKTCSSLDPCSFFRQSCRPRRGRHISALLHSTDNSPHTTE
ncbi:hypothetical protein NUW58_g9087 [Xylaria curta]|uniref:Uncharacterized protein n=1 Tax=Xylaria curta TaxID=42375 RepID=A0ACC1N1T7_9PEZI|nr:hypothetical protein NUW58_g9087 [Xylaria curta]